jgi:hypothetical protein
LVGGGNFGIVYKAVQRINGKVYAIKRLHWMIKILKRYPKD